MLPAGTVMQYTEYLQVGVVNSDTAVRGLFRAPGRAPVPPPRRRSRAGTAPARAPAVTTVVRQGPLTARPAHRLLRPAGAAAARRWPWRATRPAAR